MDKEQMIIKDLDGFVIDAFGEWIYSPEDVSAFYGDVIVENAKGEQVLSW